MAKFYTARQVASSIDAAMVKSGLTQADLARLLGVAPQLVSLARIGVSINPKVAEWAGFERAESMFQRKKAQ